MLDRTTRENRNAEPIHHLKLSGSWERSRAQNSHSNGSLEPLSMLSWRSRFSGAYCPQSLSALTRSFKTRSCGLKMCMLPACSWDNPCEIDFKIGKSLSPASSEDLDDRTKNIAEIKEELEMYGVDTKGLVERSELVEALRRACERQERLSEEIERLKGVKVSRIKEELQKRFSINTIYFEKAEYIRELAEARVDEVVIPKESNPPVTESSANTNSSSFFSDFSTTVQNLQTVSSLFQNAQTLVKDPKFAEVVQRAQSNPKVMAAVMDCMKNPSNFVKYQSDPEITLLLNELSKLQ